MSLVQTNHGTVDTQVAAARLAGKTVKTIRAWRAKGGESAGFLPDGRVNVDVMIAWSKTEGAKRTGTDRKKDAELVEKIRKLKLANDRFEGKLIERAFMAERIQRCAGKVQAFRLKSEAEHPTRFAAAAGDVPACRIVIREIWDEIAADIQSLGAEFS